MRNKTILAITLTVCMIGVTLASAACSGTKITTVSSTKTVLTPGPTNTVYTISTVSNVITAQFTPLPTTVGGPVSFLSSEVVPPYVPAGPTVKITLRNDGDQPIVSLSMILWVVTPAASGNTIRPVQFAFDVSGFRPMTKTQAASATATIIGPGDYRTLATVNATTQSGQNYSYLISIS
jgi:hypothetical protein